MDPMRRRPAYDLAEVGYFCQPRLLRAYAELREMKERRCDGCEHGSDWSPPNTEWHMIGCAKDADIHSKDWYCADYEPKDPG